MKISIIIPSYNNLKYLIFTINSIKKNSFFEHEIIIHVNEGSDGTLDYVKNNGLLYTFSKSNIGVCSSVNQASKKASTNYIFYSHDDMFYCKNWDVFLKEELNRLNNNLYYLSGTTISINNGLINHDCGSSPENFNEDKFNDFIKNDKSKDLQGSHWAPHLIHKELWIKIGGFSEEFNPGDGSDPDLCMKLWLNNVRVFKTISKIKVYHFSSITTRKRNISLNNGTRTFLLKYGFNPRFFRKYYLQGNGFNLYEGKLNAPKITLDMFLSLIVNKLKYFYFKVFS